MSHLYNSGATRKIFPGEDLVLCPFGQLWLVSSVHQCWQENDFEADVLVEKAESTCFNRIEMSISSQSLYISECTETALVLFALSDPVPGKSLPHWSP